jgi:two-component system, OmpR family, alkaline phosphatase synthesis response regulator PhoP
MEQEKRGTILIVEDEPVFRLIYRGVFEHDGYEVLEAVDGENGWEMAVEKKPDMILLDLILPKISGYEVLQRIRKEESLKETPVVIFSIMGAEKDIQKALELGANYYRVKGSNSPRDILIEINSIFDKIKPVRNETA